MARNDGSAYGAEDAAEETTPEEPRDEVIEVTTHHNASLAREHTMKVSVSRVHLDSMGYASHGLSKGRYWGVGQPLYYCRELEALRDERPIRECNEPYCRASDINAAHEIFVRRMTETLQLPTRKDKAEGLVG